MTDLTVNVSKTIEAPITKVFDAWLDSDTLAKFILPMPGMENSQVENEAHEGGAFTIIMQVGESKIPHTGKYLEIDRPRKLVFTWESPESIDNSIVTLIFTRLSDSQTKIELTHVRFIDEERRSNHEGGWGNILSKLDEVLNS
ncbi:MAG: SRPBCC domain-containing protein [Gammaproteobacteria bacterium]